MSATLRASDPSAKLVAGRYKIDAALGAGGAAQVYRVRDMSSGHVLALKLLHAGASQRTTAMFELEYKTLAGLSHPRVIQVFDYGRDGASAFYTMELLEGEDLSRHAPVSFRETCRYLRDAAEALGLLHARRLVHRDVSPRNLWRTPDQRIKLIDFGALTPFGPTEHLVGTPPLMPPEALGTHLFDQRSDLYALGGVGYFLLTGMHAYRAREPRDLTELWKSAPMRPSQSVAELMRTDLEPVPAALDDLIMALLSHDPLARPATTAEVIDRLDVLLGTGRLSQRESREHVLWNAAFVGRSRERRCMGRLLRLAAAGRGQSAVVDGEAGAGRSRLLAEFASEARINGATVLYVDAATARDHYGIAVALALKLLDAQPALALSAAQPYAPVLAHVSGRLRERLKAAPVEDTTGELRVRIQAALRDWILAVARKVTLLVLVDGAEMMDEGSAAFLLALSLARKNANLMLVCALLRDRRREVSATELALLKGARLIKLGALSDAHTFELLQSAFGNIEHLPRLANRLQQTAHGNPGHLLALSEQLIRRHVVSFSAGTWVLPQELPDALLGASRDEALTARLAFLSPEARELGRLLSVHHGPLPLRLCEAVASSAVPSLYARVPELLEEEILLRGEEGLRFAREPLRLLLLSELSPEARKRARGALGAYLLSTELGTLERIRAGVHLLDGGDERGIDVVTGCARQLAFSEPHKVKPALPSIEEGLQLMRAAKRPHAELISLLALLSIGSYYADRRYLAYGDETIRTFQELLGLNLASKLRPMLGPKLGLKVALGVASARFRKLSKSPRVPSFRETLSLLFNSVAALCGTCAVCIDREGVERYTRALEPLSGLGPRHVATFVYEHCRTVAESIRDAYGGTLPRWHRMITLLESDVEIEGMSPAVRRRYLGAALAPAGVIEAQLDDPRALRTADRLEALGMRVYELSAHQVRMMWHANQGDVKLFEHHLKQAEQLAIQQGTIWQIEMAAPANAIAVSLRMHDAMAMNRAAAQLAHSSKQVPSLAYYARRSRGAYLLLRERYQEALPLLEGCLSDEPRMTVGWGRSHGTLARVYNRLGEHDKARAACERVLREFTAEDFAFVALNLLVQTEHLIAIAGLGEVDRAKRELSELIAQHATNGGPLTLGQLHEAGVEIALLAGDRALALEHYDNMRKHYVGTGVATLVQRCQSLHARIDPANVQPASYASGEGLIQSSWFATSDSTTTPPIERLLGGGHMSLIERAERALHIIAAQAHCSRGFLYVLDEEAQLRPIAALGGEAPSAAIERSLAARIAIELKDENTVMSDHASNDNAAGDPNVFSEPSQYYRISLLFAPGTALHSVMGAAVVASEAGVPPACSPDVLDPIARHLSRALQEEMAAQRRSP